MPDSADSTIRRQDRGIFLQLHLIQHTSLSHSHTLPLPSHREMWKNSQHIVFFTMCTCPLHLQSTFSFPISKNPLCINALPCSTRWPLELPMQLGIITISLSCTRLQSGIRQYSTAFADRGQRGGSI